MTCELIFEPPRQGHDMENDDLQKIAETIPIPGGPWSTLVFAVIAIGMGVAAAFSWWRRSAVDNAEAGARINSLSDLQAIIAAERKENAALKQENAELKERADRFAAERNDLYVKIGEMSGEIRALRQELDSLKGVLDAMRGDNAQI